MKRYKIVLGLLLCMAHGTYINMLFAHSVSHADIINSHFTFTTKRGMLSPYIRPFCQVGIEDIAIVGGKNASLGELITQLKEKGIRVPDGFAVTTEAYWQFITHNDLLDKMRAMFVRLGTSNDLRTVQEIGAAMRSLILQAEIPTELADDISHAYAQLSQQYNKKVIDVAVRSSATAEDLPDASFAGQQDTYLNIRGVGQLLDAYKKCIASLFTDRAIAYRQEKGFDHFDIALSVGVQKMVRSDMACSGVAFSLDTETGFSDAIIITSAFGLGEGVVQGSVTPDEFVVHKPTLAQGFKPIIKKVLGNKESAMVYTDNAAEPTAMVPLSIDKQHMFTLTDQEVLQLARMVMTIEKHYSAYAGKAVPVDVEWAKDGFDGQLYIVQARPETVHSQTANSMELVQYALKDGVQPTVLHTGLAVGKNIASGRVRVLKSVADINQMQEGDVLVTTITDPDWVPAMKKAAAIITERGGRTCHAAIVSRELGVPAILGIEHATQLFKDGQEVTVDCSQGATGYVYEGLVSFEETRVRIDDIPDVPVDVYVNVADPSSAFKFSQLPVSGVGLARLEFVITYAIQIHPFALLYPDRVSDVATRALIDQVTCAYEDKTQFFVDTLAHNIGMIAAAFYPRPVIVRFSDFKSNEYRGLVGGVYFEPEEENPMIGFRGASRYYHPLYRPAFDLECQALKKVRDEMGLTNVKAMIPFVRTLTEARLVIETMAENGLRRGENGLEVIAMCEIPSNVLLIDEFSEYFDGFSIGSNDLTQMVLAIDRDSEVLRPLFDERDPAVKKMFEAAIKGARRNNVYIGVCGQAPSDHPELALEFIDWGVHSLSFNADTVVPFLMRFK